MNKPKFEMGQEVMVTLGKKHFVAVVQSVEASTRSFGYHAYHVKVILPDKDRFCGEWVLLEYQMVALTDFSKLLYF